MNAKVATQKMTGLNPKSAKNICASAFQLLKFNFGRFTGKINTTNTPNNVKIKTSPPDAGIMASLALLVIFFMKKIKQHKDCPNYNGMTKHRLQILLVNKTPYKIFIALIAFVTLNFATAEIAKADDNKNPREEIKVGDVVYKMSDPKKFGVVKSIRKDGFFNLERKKETDEYYRANDFFINEALSEYTKVSDNCAKVFPFICIGEFVYIKNSYKKGSIEIIGVKDDIAFYKNKDSVTSENAGDLVRAENGCTKIKPEICVGDEIYSTKYPDSDHGIVFKVLSNNVLLYINKGVSYNSGKQINEEDSGDAGDYAKVINVCTKSKPEICAGDEVYSKRSPEYNGKVKKILSNDMFMYVKETFESKVNNSGQKKYTEIWITNADAYAKVVNECTNTKPEICIGDEIYSTEHPGSFHGIVTKVLSNNAFFYKNGADKGIETYHSGGGCAVANKAIAGTQGTITKPAGVSKSQDIKNFVFSKVNTRNLPQNLLELSMNIHVDANPETWSPSKLMSSLSEDLKSKYNSEMSQVLTLYAVNTYVNAMTSELITTKIKPKYDEAMKELEKAKWSSINQVPVEKQTVDLAIAIVQKVLLTVRAGASDAELVKQIDAVLSGGEASAQPLLSLADIAALESGSLDKFVAFRSYCRALSNNKTTMLNMIVSNQNTVAEGKLLLAIIGWMAVKN